MRSLVLILLLPLAAMGQTEEEYRQKRQKAYDKDMAKRCTDVKALREHVLIRKPYRIEKGQKLTSPRRSGPKGSGTSTP